MTKTPRGDDTEGVTSLNTALGRGVKAHLAQSGKDVPQLAEALGLSVWSVYRRLKGRTPWTDVEIDGLARFMGTTVPRLIARIYKPQTP